VTVGADEPGARSEERLIPVFIPALVVLLARSENDLGRPLTEREVVEIRDRGVCMMMRESMAIEMDQQRGYDDVDPEKVWEQWQKVRAEIMREMPAED
jgi:hypothetical protein